MRNLIVIILFAIAFQAGSRNIYYVTVNKTTAYFECILKGGYDRVIIELNEDGTNSIARDRIQRVINAKNAGLKVEALFYPCRGRTI